MSEFKPSEFLRQKEEEKEGSTRRGTASIQQEPESPTILTPSAQRLKNKYDTGPDYERAQFDHAVDSGMQANAERSSKILAIQEKTGLPRDLVERKIEELGPAVLNKSFDKRRFYNEN